MKELARMATSRGGDILEIGFGMGISADYIEKSKKVSSHTVIECHPDIIKYAAAKFKNEIAKGKLILMNGFWENIIPFLKESSFDGILFDTGPIDKEVEFFHFFPFFKYAYQLLKKGGIFTYFSDEPRDFSKEHLKQLKIAGFSNINCKICQVAPPKSCKYWEYKTIIAPIVIK